MRTIGSAVSQILLIYAHLLAMITVIGQCAGAGDLDAAQQYRLKLMKLTYAVMGILNFTILLTLPLTLKFFALSLSVYVSR